MVLTFLNLVVISGILVGLAEGSALTYRSQYSGDVLISRYPTKEYIERSTDLQGVLQAMPDIVSFSPRYLGVGTLESNYKTNIGPKLAPEVVTTEFVGIDATDEALVTNLPSQVIEGEYLVDGEEGYVLVGSNLLEQYAGALAKNVLKGVKVGDKIRISINGKRKEVIVKGIVKNKISEVSLRLFFADTELRSLLSRTDLNVSEIAVVLRPTASSTSVTNYLKEAGFGTLAKIETSEESEGTFLSDIRKTFAVLGNVIGGIGLIVASITIFIVIYINAVTRRKYIGIAKGIGISELAIEFSYVLQSLFYALIGVGIGMVILYFGIKPYIDLHPIDFPFSDGILVAPIDEVSVRVGILVIVTMIAGYLPAKLIVRKNTLDAILGRNE